jgi:hypothetical protein
MASLHLVSPWVLFLLLAGVGCAASPTSAPAYVFSWPFLDQEMSPRGGTTRGPVVSLAEEPGLAWQRLQTAGPDRRARDRAAILAMAGDYRTSFDFLETVIFAASGRPARPYRSWGTERVYVLEDREDFVSLQHVLVMFVVDETGETQGPFVQKHWRQDWRFEPESLLDYVGERRFEVRPLSAEQRRGAWSQTVYQVDDSPRYGSIGRWSHGEAASIWSGGEASRPLPRREHSVRSDYQRLAGRNRHTILPTGWTHEQDNLKLVETQAHSRPLAREIGVNRYERIQDFDFTAADAYWSATDAYWARVRAGWARRLEPGVRLRVATTCDGTPAFALFFAGAAEIEAGSAATPEAQEVEIERLLDCVVVRERR